MQWPDHLLSLEEWDALPEDNTHRYELVEGNLLASPKPVSLIRLPCASPVTSFVINFRQRSGQYPRYQAGDVLLPVEIISPGSRRTDRLVKFAEYADAGIPRHWIVDLGERTTLAAYELAEGAYKLVVEGTGPLRLTAPDEVVIDPAGLR